jgi:hypothetical protein
MSARSLLLAVAGAGALSVAVGSPLSAQGRVGSAGRQELPPADPSRAGTFEAVTVKADAVIGIRLEAPITSRRAKVEDRVRARVTRDVTVNDRVAIPAGSRVEGYVTIVERGGRLKDAARVGVRFTTVILGDGLTRLPIQTETVFRTAESPAERTAARIGTSAVVGAILGALAGGKKGAIVGGAAGAAGGAAVTAAGDPDEVLLPAGTPLTIRLSEPVTVLVEREPAQR